MPVLNITTRLAETVASSPVFGLRAGRGDLSRKMKLPKPDNPSKAASLRL